MNKYSKIKAMTIEEMAEFLSIGWNCTVCDNVVQRGVSVYKKAPCDGECAKHCRKWLEMEVEEDEKNPDTV